MNLSPELTRKVLELAAAGQPKRYEISVPNYRPPTSNALFRAKFRGRMALERECRQLIRCYSRGVPQAAGKRRVSMAVTLAVRQRLPDADEQCYKAVLDALANCGLLIDDSRRWCECVPTEFVPSRQRQPHTLITLEDVTSR